VGVPAGLLLGLDGGLGGEGGQPPEGLGDTPKGALAERAIGERVGPVDLGEEHAVGEEAVGAEHRGAWSGSFLVVA
jgi:hypothetical protein